MKYLHNIDKSVSRRRSYGKPHYVGYAHGIWNIHQSNPGTWCAVKRDGKRDVMHAKTLEALSAKLDHYAKNVSTAAATLPEARI
jgi:hypothetical protein